jgi:hypothetical protein
MPESTGFRAAYSADIREKLGDYLARISRDYDVPVFDATEAATEASFADGHHLLPSGAAMFASRFERDVLAPFLGDGAQPLQTVRRGDRPAAELAGRPAASHSSAVRQ